MSEKTNKIIQVINVALFCSVLLIGGVISLSMKKKDISETENRKLAAFPAYADSAPFVARASENAPFAPIFDDSGYEEELEPASPRR